MTEIHVVADLDQAILGRFFPAVTRWNRLEGRPRTHHFDRALCAEVRDALWMLSRQWQFGEFMGDDAGSPVLARACIDLRAIDHYQAADGAVLPLSADDMLEPRVERRTVPLRAGAQYLSLDLRMIVGRRWMRLLERERSAGRLSADYRPAYLGAYAVAVPNPTLEADAEVCAHADAWQEAGCAAERAMDGIALLEHLEVAGNTASDGVGAAAIDVAPLAALADRLRAWFANLIDQPGPGDDAWLPERLEYAFGVSAPTGESDATGGTEAVMRAPEFHHGMLDWFALERSRDVRLGDPGQPPVDLTRIVRTFIPTSVVFDGMPSTRWWAFEDRRTNFGQVTPDTTDLGKLMLMEFALVFANDWFVVPWELPVGTLAQMRGIALTTVFDERLWIEPVREQGSGEGWQRWTMFTLTEMQPGSASPGSELVVLPVSPKVQEHEAMEDVSLVRDEMANMVWAIEHQIPLPSGWRRAGSEVAHELRSHLQGLVGPPTTSPPPPAAPIRYRVMNAVPEQWIPFIPVHVDGSTRETQLQRAAMPRLLDRDARPPVKVRPRTPLLRQNLPRAYFVHEEEVPRAGARVSQTYQRTRRPDGAVVVWYGARKQTGRGEGSSGLAFDQIVDSPST